MIEYILALSTSYSEKIHFAIEQNLGLEVQLYVETGRQNILLVLANG